MRLASSTNDINKHKPCITPNNYCPACHVYSGDHKARTTVHALFISPQFSNRLQVSMPVSFHFCCTLGSLCYFPLTVVFIFPSIKLMPSTWSAISRYLFLLTVSPTLEKVRSNVALDACAHNEPFTKSTISACFNSPSFHESSTSVELWSSHLFVGSFPRASHLWASSSQSALNDLRFRRLLVFPPFFWPQTSCPPLVLCLNPS